MCTGHITQFISVAWEAVSNQELAVIPGFMVLVLFMRVLTRLLSLAAGPSFTDLHWSRCNLAALRGTVQQPKMKKIRSMLLHADPESCDNYVVLLPVFLMTPRSSQMTSILSILWQQGRCRSSNELQYVFILMQHVSPSAIVCLADVF